MKVEEIRSASKDLIVISWDELNNSLRRFWGMPIKMGKMHSLGVPTQPKLILPNERQNAHSTNIAKNAEH